jgi:hypothetical protein
MTDKKDALAVTSHAGQIAVLRPQTIAEAMELAVILAKSTLVPKEYQGKPENVLVAMQLGAEVGLSPFQALQSIAVINGKPAIYGDAGLAIVKASGLLEGMGETDDPVTQTATCWMKRKNAERVERSFSQADAERIMMYERDSNGNAVRRRLADRATWQSFPKRMRQWRARWWVLHDLFPDLLKGMRGAEEYERGASPLGAEDVDGAEDYSGLMPREKAAPGPPVVEGAAVMVDGEFPEPPTGPVEPEPDGQTVLPGMPAPPPPPPPPPPPAIMPDAPAAPLQVVEEYTVSFEMNGTQYMTNGITKDQLKESFKLAPQVDRKAGKGTAAKLLHREFAREHRVDLTREEADRYLVRLREILE